MADQPNPTLLTTEGVRVAIEGCGHGALNPIYAAVDAACQARNWPGVDVLIICGDFQATRNGTDVEVMSVPAKYRVLGDFHEYYSGARTAPYLTLFIGGNHEAAAYLWELYYGGWAAPNIFYMGAANVVRVGPLRIAGLSGIWKGFDYRKAHGERLPFGQGDVKSFYHVRELDVRKLLQLREQVDVGLSHDWPRGVEKHGDTQQLYRMRPMWKQESLDGSLGSVAAEYVMDRLRPAYWFSAHMHWKFSAIKSYPPPGEPAEVETPTETPPQLDIAPEAAPAVPATVADPNEIELDMDDSDEEVAPAKVEAATAPAPEAPSTAVPDDLRAQLPASFLKPKETGPKRTPGQPVPSTINNTQTRFLALNKCEPKRDFLQVCDLHPVDPAHLATYPPSSTSDENPNTRYPLQYDPEWLAITRVFHPHLTIGDRTATVPTDEGEPAYRPLIDTERAWVDANIVATDKLAVPHNFAPTAPALVPGSESTHSELWTLHGGVQPHEYTNPQTAAFCELLGLANLWDASEEEREKRRRVGPPVEENGGFRGGRGRGGRGGFGRGRGGRGRGGGGRGRGGRW
ncbi:unnamed protein product [Discula destructiva]